MPAGLLARAQLAWQALPDLKMDSKPNTSKRHLVAGPSRTAHATKGGGSPQPASESGAGCGPKTEALSKARRSLPTERSHMRIPLGVARATALCRPSEPV